MASGTPDYSPRIITSAESVEQKKVSVTASDSTATFTQKVRAYVVYNDGPNAVHINYDATATTNLFKIPAKAWKMLDIPVTVLHFICATGETATVYCEGVY